MDGLRIAILGPGGVGGMLGALLASQGHAVTCLARPGTAAVIDRAGLRLTSDRFGNVSGPARGAPVLEDAVDVCLVTTKATQLDDALQRVPAEVLGNGLLVPLLNGVEHMVVLRERYPGARTVAGVIRVAASRPAPGEARHDGPLAAVQLGAGAEVLAQALTGTGLDVTVRPDEAGLLWDKLCFLAPLALLTTLAGTAVGPVREHRAAELRSVVEEVAAVARAAGATADPAATLTFTASVPGTMRSSMERDADAGSPTELEAIGGAVLRAADRHGVDVPVTRRIVTDLRARLL